MVPRATSMLSKYFITQLYPSPKETKLMKAGGKKKIWVNWTKSGLQPTAQAKASGSLALCRGSKSDTTVLRQVCWKDAGNYRPRLIG